MSQKNATIIIPGSGTQFRLPLTKSQQRMSQGAIYSISILREFQNHPTARLYLSVYTPIGKYPTPHCFAPSLRRLPHTRTRGLSAPKTNNGPRGVEQRFTRRAPSVLENQRRSARSSCWQASSQRSIPCSAAATYRARLGRPTHACSPRLLLRTARRAIATARTGVAVPPQHTGKK
eukprot:scaffold38427_cov36-Phaeocystis_antarctica.AAC.1